MARLSCPWLLLWGPLSHAAVLALPPLAFVVGGTSTGLAAVLLSLSESTATASASHGDSGGLQGCQKPSDESLENGTKLALPITALLGLSPKATSVLC